MRRGEMPQNNSKNKLNFRKELNENINKDNCKKLLFTKDVWNVITDQTIWKYPIKKQYGGLGLSWKECIGAIKYFIKNSNNVNLISSITIQLSALFIISTYGNENQKINYLPKLMSGKKALIVHVDQEYAMMNTLHHLFESLSISLSNSVILIGVAHGFSTDKNDIEYYIFEENSNIFDQTEEQKSKIRNFLKPKFVFSNAFIPYIERKLILDNLTYFNKIVYGLLVSDITFNRLKINEIKLKERDITKLIYEKFEERLHYVNLKISSLFEVFMNKCHSQKNSMNYLLH